MATTKREATIDDLYAADDSDGGKFELVDGELVWMPPPGFQHLRISLLIASSLLAYEAQTQSGYAASGNLSYVVRLPHRRTFNPDASYTYGRPPITPKFIDGPPLFAVEIRSPSNYGPKMDAEYAEKRRDYFAAGTVVVWDVAPRTRTIASYRADRADAPATFCEGDEADAEPALPGWRVAVASLFPPTEQAA